MMKKRPVISGFLFAVGLVGLIIAFIAQWLIFEPGNFSDSAGTVYIPFLGEHGIYTSRALGIAWYGGLALFLIFDVATLLWRAISRKRL